MIATMIATALEEKAEVKPREFELWIELDRLAVGGFGGCFVAGIGELAAPFIRGDRTLTLEHFDRVSPSSLNQFERRLAARCSPWIGPSTRLSGG